MADLSCPECLDDDAAVAPLGCATVVAMMRCDGSWWDGMGCDEMSHSDGMRCDGMWCNGIEWVCILWMCIVDGGTAASECQEDFVIIN